MQKRGITTAFLLAGLNPLGQISAAAAAASHGSTEEERARAAEIRAADEAARRQERCKVARAQLKILSEAEGLSRAEMAAALKAGRQGVRHWCE